MSTGAQGIATLTFDTDPNPGAPVVGSNFATITITGQTALAADDAIDMWIQGTDSTTSHNAYEHQITPIRLAATNVVAGVGFDITAYSDLRLDGNFQVRWAWVGGVGEKTGSAVINFPVSAQSGKPIVGTNTASLTLTGLTSFNDTDAIEVWVQGSDTTADHNEVEHALVPIQLRATNPVSGEGFTIVANSPYRLDGDFKVRYAFTP
jgi:hypothetical protein